MLARIRSRGVTLAINPDGPPWRVLAVGTLTALQRKYLEAHEAELLAALWTEDGTVECTWCGLRFDCHKQGVYAETWALICGACNTRGGGWRIKEGA